MPRASAKTVEEWLEGFETGETWFGEDFAYDITDEEEACWELLQRPITVLDAGQREEIYPRVTPGGEKVNDDKLGGFINGASAAVHVLGEDEDGWTAHRGAGLLQPRHPRLRQGPACSKPSHPTTSTA